MHEDYEQLLKLTPEEMAVQILEKRRLLADQISFIIQGLTIFATDSLLYLKLLEYFTDLSGFVYS